MWIVVGNLSEIIGTIISVTSYGPGQLIAGRVLIVSRTENLIDPVIE